MLRYTVSRTSSREWIRSGAKPQLRGLSGLTYLRIMEFVQRSVPRMWQRDSARAGHHFMQSDPANATRGRRMPAEDVWRAFWCGPRLVPTYNNSASLWGLVSKQDSGHLSAFDVWWFTAWSCPPPPSSCPLRITWFGCSHASGQQGSKGLPTRHVLPGDEAVLTDSWPAVTGGLQLGFGG